LLEHKAVQNVEYWTSGTQRECPGKLHWCSIDRKLQSRKFTWGGKEDGECVSVKYGPNQNSTFAKSACDQRFNFICEVFCFVGVAVTFSPINEKAHNKGTMAEALQGECMDVWNITIGKFKRCH
jgi:hypothetical protein